MELNWVDWTIILVIIYYILSGWEKGLLQLSKSLAVFLGSLWTAIKFHHQVGAFLSNKFGIPPLWTRVTGYLLVALTANAILSDLVGWIASKVPSRLEKTKTNRVLGAILSIVNALVITAFFLLLTLSLPLRGTVKQDIRNSLLGPGVS